ncbi:MAG: glutamate-5-semialdehyde dehydrogenase [Firmicutes bacterium]|nr:glutamate-5-semialdehyde dehydrogenase [Bacillota bacterium]
MSSYFEEIGQRAQTASRRLIVFNTEKKNACLRAAAQALVESGEEILAANLQDIAAAEAKGMKASLVDRLRLTVPRIEAMAEGICQVADLPDPVGEAVLETVRPNGLQLRQERVPIGVIGIIYESRPNVTADAFALCFKTGNAVILRGGSDAIHSNMAITKVLREALASQGAPEDAIQLVEDTSRESAAAMMRLRQYIDVLIPRGGAGLIRTVVENSTVPVIETGSGNCHICVDQAADVDLAVKIIHNAKTQRTGVCNACESLVIHEKIAEQAIPAICQDLLAAGVEIHGDEMVCRLIPQAIPAVDEDWGTEYLDMILSIKTVTGIDEAIEHINRYNTKHSEAIITKDMQAAEQFQQQVDAACVYVNASTRFTDGFEFGFGAEIGISTQKLHARGPMGLVALTTTKYKIMGDGQIRS